MHNTVPRKTKASNALLILVILVVGGFCVALLANSNKTEGDTDVVKASGADSMVQNVTSTDPGCDDGTFTVSFTSKVNQLVRVRQVDTSALLSKGDLDKLIEVGEGESIVINGPELEFGQSAKFQIDNENGLLSPANIPILGVEVTRSGDCPQ